MRKGDKSAGQKLFIAKCAGCHTLAAAGTNGTIGPNLDTAFAEARAEGYKDSAIEDIVAGQIRAPGQYPTDPTGKTILIFYTSNTLVQSVTASPLNQDFDLRQVNLARSLRKKEVPAEALLWKAPRNRVLRRSRITLSANNNPA